MGVTEAQLAVSSRDLLEEAIAIPREYWAVHRDEVSLALARSGLVGCSRVARGSHPGIGPHWWVVLGENCFGPDVVIVDVTAPACYRARPSAGAPDYMRHGGVVVGLAQYLSHYPAGAGVIWSYGLPVPGTGAPIALTPVRKLSEAALAFLAMIGPMDATGWRRLARSPVGGWPAAEILSAMDDTTEIRSLVPEERLGMLTGRNPGGRYR